MQHISVRTSYVSSVGWPQVARGCCIGQRGFGRRGLRVPGGGLPSSEDWGQLPPRGGAQAGWRAGPSKVGGRGLRQDDCSVAIFWRGQPWVGVVRTPELVGQSSSCAVSSGARTLPSLPGLLAGSDSHILTEHWLSVAGSENAFLSRKAAVSAPAWAGRET